MFQVTRRWVKSVGSPVNGAWNAQQLIAVGLSWPPTSGWIEDLCGREITDQQKETVERLRVESLATQARQREEDCRHQKEVYYTWPDGQGGWVGSETRPGWWDR